MRKLAVFLIAVLLLASGAAYGYGVYYFSEHFFPGSMVNGFNCSYMTAADAEALMDEKAGAYALAVNTMNNGREAITAGEVGLKYRPDGLSKELIDRQERYLWFLHFNQAVSYDMSRELSYDNALMSEAISNMDCVRNMVQPKDAQIVLKNGVYEVEPEVVGTALDLEKVRQCIVRAMLTGQESVDLEAEGCYQKPVTFGMDAQMAANCEKMNQMIQVIITYDFADRTERVDSEQIRDWFEEDENGDVIISREAVYNYVCALADQYDTLGKERPFTTYDGRETTVSGGDYGWAIDRYAETEELSRAIEELKTQVREPVYAQTAQSRDSATDIGYTFVEVDLTTQCLVYYEGGVPKIQTFCVSSSEMSEPERTPTGVYRAGVKVSPQVISRGYSKNVFQESVFADSLGFGDSFESAQASEIRAEEARIGDTVTVQYYMPYADMAITEGVARSEYGGSIYIMNGTKGDIEIDVQEAARLFEVFEEGMPVIVYWS